MTTAINRTRLIACASALFALTACGPSPFEPAESRTIGIETPPELALRSIEADRLTLRASVDGRALGSARNGNDWELVTTVVPDTNFELELEWCYRDLDEGSGVDGVESDCQLPLATLSRTVDVGSSDLSLSIRFDEFRRDFDEDEDGSANYIEVRDDFDPRNDNVCPDCRTDVDLTVVRRSVRPDIDGAYFNGSGDTRVDVWSESQLNDREGRLHIDTPLAGSGAGIGLSGRENDTQPPKWGVLHDGRDLFLFVLGEGVPKSKRFDSAEEGTASYADDDSIEVFLETPSRSVRLVIPVADERGGPNVDEQVDVDARDGTDAGDVFDAIAFATCTCDDERDFYELRVSLAWLGAGSGDVIGIEVQINDDDDGGAVDERWGWRAAAGSGRDLDGGLPGRALLQ